jgi:succinate dehydrogenase / fumarate reductase flavoprotein subunit
MSRYASHAMELAPRDIVARAIRTEINEGRGYEGGYVLLDLRHLGAKKIMERLPGIRQIAMDFAGIDPIEEPLPIQPAQHYSMGGIPTDSDGVTPLKGLYAAGECACVSVHGANRLGGNSLLETIVFGKRAGEHAARKAGKSEMARFAPAQPPSQDVLKEAVAIEEARLTGWLCAGEGERPADIRDDLTHLMTEKVGIFRDEQNLKEALAKIKELRARFAKTTVRNNTRRLNQELVTALDVQGMLDLAELVTLGALARTESRGSHFRTDFKQRDDEHWMKHTLARLTDAGPQLTYSPVRVTKYKPTKREY